MKQLSEFIPLVIFFLFYKMDPKIIQFSGEEIQIGGIYSATYALIMSTVIVYAYLFIKEKTLAKSKIITLLCVFLFGGLTLFFQNESFLKWKAPIINWIFATILIVSQYVSKKTIIQKILDKNIKLPVFMWRKINLSWAIFFVIMGGLNLYIAFYHHKYWVDFKVFGSMILMLIFATIQSLIIYKYLPKNTTD